jgi:hypothetical protein
LAITPNPTAFKIATTFQATLNTSTAIAGSIGFYDTVFGFIGTATMTNNVASFQTSELNTGTYNVYARYPGSTTAPKWFPIQSATTSLEVKQGLELPAPALNIQNDGYQGNRTPYVIGETQTFTATISTSTILTGDITFYANNRPISTATWVNNVAVSTGTFATAGTYVVYGLWRGKEISGLFYADAKTANQIITATSGYVLGRDIILTAEQPTVYNEAMAFTATVSTSTIMGGIVDFYANGQLLGNATFSTTTNKATLSASISSTGSYAISANWRGGYIDNGRYISN